MIWAKGFGDERGGGPRTPDEIWAQRSAGPRRLPPLAATFHRGEPCGWPPLPPCVDLGHKMAGTGKKGARFPVPSLPHPGQGPQPRAAPQVPGAWHRRAAERVGKGRETRVPGGTSAPFLGRQTGSGGCGGYASWICSSSVRSRERQEGRLRGYRDTPSATGSCVRLEHPRSRLTPAARSRAGAGRCRQAGATQGTQTPGSLLTRAGPAEAEEQQSGERRARSFLQGAG